MEKKRVKMSLDEINLATNNFSDENYIGKGGFGDVYKGKLTKSGQEIAVAVKRLDRTRGQGYREFKMEIQMLSCCRHANIISLVGYCEEKEERILVYELATHGSLDKHLSNAKLSWMQRLKISLGAARGFSYLHNDVGTEYRILHRDIKSANILLNENWEAKISDFGLSKAALSEVEFSTLVTDACGTKGYIDPQYMETGTLTNESDVYSFGVMLLEILCGRSVLVATYHDKRRFLVSLAKKSWEQGTLHDIILLSIKNEIKKRSLDVFSDVAYQCLNENRSERPTMSSIVQKLEQAMQYQQSFMSNTNTGHGDTKLSPQPRSPGPGPKVGTAATSPFHQRLACTSLDSPNRKLDDGKNAGHPLPLPPGSPTSSSSALKEVLSNMKTLSVTDNSSCQPSKWKKGRLLGRGTFGDVYLGFNSENGQMCAIKEVKVVADDPSSKECLKQLNQEITLLSQLSHPNIVQYYGSELGEETLSVYLEYVSGGSINKFLQKYGAFEEPVIQNYTRQVLSGLAYLHKRNTIHRDIKGANILVDPNGEIKLADFGMAKHITNCTSMLSFKGSPYWMAPEVVMNTNGYNLAVDIWSLGCTVLEMATSKPPWGQYEGVAAIFKIGNSKDMPDIPVHLSNNAKSFIKQCLQRDPSLRPSASKLLDHPFVRDQSTSRGANLHLTKEAFPFTFDGSRTPLIKPLCLTASEMYPNRTNMHSFDVPVATTSRGAMLSPRRNPRAITSLPVSPTASPLRQYGYRNGYVSPPHPSFTTIGQSQSNYNMNDVFAVPSRHNAKDTHDPRYEVPHVKPQTPTRTARLRLI